MSAPLLQAIATGDLKYCHPLLQAVETGDLKKIKKLVRLKCIDINISEKIPDGMSQQIGTGYATPLLLAFTKAYGYPHNTKLRTQILQVLLSHPRIDINIMPNYCLLHLFIDKGDLELVGALIKHPNIDTEDVENGVVIAIRSKDLSKPTNKKLRNEIIKVLLSHPGVSFDYYEDNTWSCLLGIFIKNGELALVKSLVKHPKIKVEDISSGITLAIEGEHFSNPANKKVQNDIIKTLLEHPKVDVNVRKADGDTALHVAVAKEQIKTVETLLKHPNIDVNALSTDPSYAYTPLDMSLLTNTTSRITKLLLDHPKTDVNKTDMDLRLPLSLPIRDKRNFECFEMLFNHKNIDVNAIDHELRQTPLACRALQKRCDQEEDKAFPNSKYYLEKALRMLLNHPNVDLSITDGEEMNILHHMILSVEDSKDEAQYVNMISEVLENNPDLIKPDITGCTPIDLAKELPDSFGLMDKVLQKYFQKIGKDNSEVNSIVKEPSKSEDKKLKKDSIKCCWNCDTKDKKLYKCTGCKKAYYCSKDCITQDWPVHGGYCLKQNKNKKQNK